MSDLVREADIKEQQIVAEMKNELAAEVYDAQDSATRALLDKLAAQVRLYGKETLPEPWHTHNINWLAIEIAKDLAVTGIQLGTFWFPEGICAVCGSEA